MNEPQTSSELMMQSQLKQEPKCVLPSREIQSFLLQVINQNDFPGRLSEFVSHVKRTLESADIPK